MSDALFRTLVPGEAEGASIVLSSPLSLWGGLDLETGRICDVSHPECGAPLGGRILVMPGARGSSSSSSALVEAVRRGTAPRAIILSRVDPILVIGSLVAFDLYRVALPILLAKGDGWAAVRDGGNLRISAADGASPIVECNWSK